MYKGNKGRFTMAGRALALALSAVLTSSSLAMATESMVVNAEELASDAGAESSAASSSSESGEGEDSGSAGSGATNETDVEDNDEGGSESSTEASSEDSAADASSEDSAAEASSEDSAAEASSEEVKVKETKATVLKASELISDQGEAGYDNYTEDTVIADISFGTDKDVSSEDVYSEDNGYGFKDVDYSETAVGWSGGVYYPRVASVSEGASHVKDSDDYVAIDSKIWTEKESTGYGVYTYETTSTFDMDLYNADYNVEVTFKNPTSSSYTAALEAEDITKVTEISVDAGSTVTESFTANLVDGQLNLKFLGTSSAQSIDDADVTTVYVSNVKVTRLKTEESGEKPTVFVASDSTVQTYDEYYYPQTGWGQVVSSYFGDLVEERECDNCDYGQSQTYETTNVVVENRALGGRSSKSFIEEGKLDDILEDVKPGDYLLVQWGHNDATASRPNRYVSSSDFAQYIMAYVEGAYQRGAIPVLVTPVMRYSYKADADGNLISFNSDFEAYRQVVLQLAQENNIPYVDLTQRSMDVCNDFGIEGSKMLFLKLEAGEVSTGAYANGVNDSTHLSYYGALQFAKCVAQGIVDFADQGTNDELDTLASKVVINVATDAPAKVTNLTTTSVGAASISLSWDAAEGAELYYIFRQELADGETAESVDFSSATKYSVSSKASYVDSNCEAGKKYAYAVAGFNTLGLGELSDVISVSTKDAGYKFDFNNDDSPTMDGWIGVKQTQSYSADIGYGWTKLPGGGRYRKNNGNADSSAMADDFALGAGEFAVDLPNGTYEVTAYAGDLLSGTSTIKPAYTAEGLSIGSISCKQSLASCTATVVVSDGQLNLVVGGTNNYLNGLTITALLLAPGNLSITEFSTNASTASFLLSFTRVEEAVSYNVYQKGETDKEFQLVKSFTAQELIDNELDSRAMSASLGETYSYYMTCVTADGTESAPSNTVTQEMLDKSVAVPQAPVNLVCTSPEEGQTELQNTISLKWDKNPTEENILKYIIYRSSKAESEKGFKEFVKVGESTTNTFTDDYSDITTNIHYYYKVAAMNAGGVGELSDVCITPIAGELVAGGLESYASRALVAINLAGAAGGETKVTATDSEGNEITQGVYLSWRSFPCDFSDKELTTTFDVYRNGTAIATGISVTNLVDEAGTASDVYSVVGSNDSSLGLVSKETKTWANQYMEFSLNKPEDETMPDGTTCTYTANDMSVGDLDGDGELDLIVKWYPSNAKDNSSDGYTGKTFLDGYKVDFSTGAAELMWRIDMGINIRSGAHYTQFQVWDFDADGIAEIAAKTADGTTTYKNEGGTLVETGYVGACNADALPTDTISSENDYRNSGGYILDGPEYFTMFKGNNGEIIDTTNYIPERGSVSAWGDGYGNRVDRFISATAYLNGSTPFAVFARGYYTRIAMTAYYLTKTVDDEGNEVEQIGVYWKFDTDQIVSDVELTAQGNHGVAVNDVDGDGKDEIIYGSLVVDHDGSVLYSTELGHGDAMHVSDWIPSHPGLEVMDVHEHDNAAYHVEIHDAETGEVLTGYYTGKDTGRGLAGDIDPTAEGAEYWSIANPNYTGSDEPSWDSRNADVFSSLSGLVGAADSTNDAMIALSNGATPAVNFSLYWDGDLLADTQDHTFDSGAYAPLTTTIEKWDYENSKSVMLFESSEVFTSNGTKGNLGLVGDVLGDWRDEIIARCSGDNSKIRIYSTTIQTDYVVPCSLTDLAYREALAWQNVGYNQPAHTSYLISEGLITSQLSEGDISSTEATVNFTAANDGVYGHDVTGYVVDRADVTFDENGNKVVSEYETIAELSLDDLRASSETNTTEGSKVITGYTEGDVYAKYDFGIKSGTGDGFTNISNQDYTEAAGYGFAAGTGSAITYNRVGVGIENAGDTQTALEKACSDLSRATDEVKFLIDVPAGTYKVDVYAGAGYSNNAYNDVTVSVNGTDLGTVSQSAKVADIEKTTTVTFDEDSQIEVVTSKDGNFAIINAIVVTEMDPVYEETEGEEVVTSVYSYTDKTVAGGQYYAYKIAAVVDGKTSYFSAPLTVQTTVSIAKLNEELADMELVENAVLAEGETVADLLAAKKGTISVTDSDGLVQDVVITWDASDVDITTVGTYTAHAYIRGYSANPVDVTVNVIPNEATGFAELKDITVIVGNEVVLPTVVKATFLNGTSKDVAVTFDTSSLDINTLGDYTLIGTVEGTDVTVTQIVHVVDDYIVSVATTYAEIGYLDRKYTLPETVSATYASDAVKNVAVVWNTENIDYSSVGSTMTVEGTVEGYSEKAIANVTVKYPAAYKFDFGIDTKLVEDGWTGVTVNPKGVAKTLSSYGSAYTQEQGYGFENGDSVMQGRTEKFTQEGLVPTNVYNDFALTAGETFLVDVENGDYQIEFISSSNLKSTVTGSAEGVNFNVSSAAATYAVGTTNVTVEDGQLTIVFGGNNDRLGGIIVRKVIEDDSYYGYPEETPGETPEPETPEGEFIKKWGAVYYQLTDGTYLTGLNKIDGETYFFKDNGKMVKSAFVTVDGNTYYFDADGHMVTGFMTKWFSVSYFDENGVQVFDSMVTDENGDTYYMNTKGKMVKDSFVDFEDGTRYFDKEGKMVKDTEITRWFKKYTFDANGILVK